MADALPSNRGGILYCPDCGEGRLVGMVDVTVHPTVRVLSGGRLRVGTIVDRIRSIREDARTGTGGDMFGNELTHGEIYCERSCGFTVSGHELRQMMKEKT